MAKRYTIVVADRQTGTVRRVTIRVRSFLTAVAALFVLVIFILEALRRIDWESVLSATSDLRIREISGLILVAYSLFKLRQHFLVTYGLLEVAFGIASAWHIMDVTPPDRTAAMVAIFGSVYVMIRGFANINDGLIILERRRSPFVKSEPRKTETVKKQAATATMT